MIEKLDITIGPVERLITQEDLVGVLQYEGYTVRVRTLTYWRSEGLIGGLLRVGNTYYVEPEDQVKVIELCKTRIPELLKIELEGHEFSIERAVITSFEGELVIRLYTKDQGMLLKVLKEEDRIDAVRRSILEG